MSYKPLQEEKVDIQSDDDLDDVFKGPDPTAPSLQELSSPSHVFDDIPDQTHDDAPLLAEESHDQGKFRGKRTLDVHLDDHTPETVYQGQREDPRFKIARRVLGVGVFVMLFAFLAAAVTLIALAPSCKKEKEESLVWWKTTVIYQCYPRSFQDSNGNGSGDLVGIRNRISHFENIGVKAVWLNPIFSSPQKDNGYDISNYTNVDPLYGSMDDLKDLLQEFQARGIHLILDFVPNHTSDEHPWFIESRSSKNNSKSDWYVWADPNEFGGPPNNWISVFGGSAWSYDSQRDQYYLHQFSSFQPDLNYRNQQVVREMEGVLKFWLGLGVDGFRVDAVPFLLEDREFHNETRNPDFSGNCTVNISSADCYNSLVHNLTQNYHGIHNIIRNWRKVLNSYSSPSRERFMVGEVYADINTVMLYYGGEDGPEFDFPFNFFLLGNERWTGTNVSQLVGNWLDKMPKGAWPNWVLGNHDNFRIASKAGIYLARALNVLLLTLPGTPTTYYGEEILMTDVYVPPSQRHDKYGLRDEERTPMQWDTSENAGFSNVTPWLPLPDNSTTYNVQNESTSNTSMLSLYTRLVELRSNHSALQHTDYQLLNSTTDIYAYRRYYDESDDEFIIIVNFAPTSTATQISSVEISDPEIVLSSNMNRSEAIDLKNIKLLPGEAIVIQGKKKEKELVQLTP